jgi:hypothetical protein
MKIMGMIPQFLAEECMLKLKSSYSKVPSEDYVWGMH